MTTLSDLTERLEKATGPDRELDIRIDAASGTGRIVRADISPEQIAHITQPIGAMREGMSDADAMGVPRYTASIDAALALVERHFSAPEHFVELSIGKAAYCEIHSQSVYDELGKGEAATAPLAILIALLRARSHTESQT